MAMIGEMVGGGIARGSNPISVEFEVALLVKEWSIKSQ
jgi:hypothetical protein